MKPSYRVPFGDADYTDLNEVDAIAVAEELLAKVADGTAATFTVLDEDTDALVASVTNRRIMGTFVHQRWGGRKGDDATFSHESVFDATDVILLLSHARIIELEDESQSSDIIGQELVSWDGPFEVRITDSICDFFGVDSVEEITEEALQFARDRVKPVPLYDTTVTMTIKVRVRVGRGGDIGAFKHDLDYKVSSNTSGITVQDTEIVEAI